MDIPDIPEELRRKIIRLAAEDDPQEKDSWLEEDPKPETVIIVLLVLNEN